MLSHVYHVPFRKLLLNLMQLVCAWYYGFVFILIFYFIISIYDIIQCTPLKVNRHFGVTSHLHLQFGLMRQRRNQSEAGGKQNRLSLCC
jgi:hypothetical protein